MMHVQEGNKFDLFSPHSFNIFFPQKKERSKGISLMTHINELHDGGSLDLKTITEISGRQNLDSSALQYDSCLLENRFLSFQYNNENLRHQTILTFKTFKLRPFRM